MLAEIQLLLVDLRLAFAAVLLQHLLTALSYVHLLSLFHRDIKPANLLIFVHPHTGAVICKLADFGLMVKVDSKGCITVRGGSSALAGTYGYLDLAMFLRAGLSDDDSRPVHHLADLTAAALSVAQWLCGITYVGSLVDMEQDYAHRTLACTGIDPADHYMTQVAKSCTTDYELRQTLVAHHMLGCIDKEVTLKCSPAMAPVAAALRNTLFAMVMHLPEQRQTARALLKSFTHDLGAELQADCATMSAALMAVLVPADAVRRAEASGCAAAPEDNAAMCAAWAAMEHLRRPKMCAPMCVAAEVDVDQIADDQDQEVESSAADETAEAAADQDYETGHEDDEEEEEEQDACAELQAQAEMEEEVAALQDKARAKQSDAKLREMAALAQAALLGAGCIAVAELRLQAAACYDAAQELQEQAACIQAHLAAIRQARQQQQQHGDEEEDEHESAAVSVSAGEHQQEEEQEASAAFVDCAPEPASASEGATSAASEESYDDDEAGGDADLPDFTVEGLLRGMDLTDARPLIAGLIREAHKQQQQPAISFITYTTAAAQQAAACAQPSEAELVVQQALQATAMLTPAELIQRLVMCGMEHQQAPAA